jgi:hypothetical protein
LSGPAINQLNMSLFKNTKIGERVRLQLRVEAYNFLNHPQPGYGINAQPANAPSSSYLPSITLDNAGVPGNGFANFKDMSMARRVFQFGVRLIF